MLCCAIRLRYGPATPPSTQAAASHANTVSPPSPYVYFLFQREALGALSCEMIPHFFQSFAQEARFVTTWVVVVVVVVLWVLLSAFF